jgi:SOS-response transcriptional repressor LexA
MTELQLRVFDFIRDRIERTGVAPNYTEIAAAMGSRSRGGAHSLVAILIRDGLLEKTGAGSRNLKLPGVRLVTVPAAALRAELERRNARD